MRKILDNIYTFTSLVSPLIFLAFFLLKGQFCLMLSCSGSADIGTAWGIAMLLIYLIIMRLVRMKILYGQEEEDRGFWNTRRLHNGFLYVIISLIILLVYFLGKINGSPF